ncbi:MAG: HlyC/CorC family transporter [Clostridium sp.]|nr:HlyC/CorC family transporter [Clostridium sp.]
MSPIQWQIFILIILVLLSAFFSSSETAFTSINKIKLRQLIEEGNKKAIRVEKLIENPSKLLSTILIGNNIVNIAASSLATSIAIDAYGNNAVVLSTAIMSVVIIIFSEITPKSFAADHSLAITLKFSRIIEVLMIVINPLVSILYVISSFFIRVLGGETTKSEVFITEEELKTLVDVGSEEGVLEIDEKEMLHNIFEFGDLRVKDVMVQRVDIMAIDADSNYTETLKTIKEEQLSRFPVYEGDIDHVIGILNVKDLLFLKNKEKETFNLRNYIRPPYFTYEFKKITDLFQELKSERIHIAIILDEYGGTVGVVTIEDLLEEIVGEIDDEYDLEPEEDIIRLSDNEYIVSGSYRIDDLNEFLEINIESEEFDSIGGFLIGLLGTFPENGEIINFEHLKFIVEEVDKNRIIQIKLIILE